MRSTASLRLNGVSHAFNIGCLWAHNSEWRVWAYSANNVNMSHSTSPSIFYPYSIGWDFQMFREIGDGWDG